MSIGTRVSTLMAWSTRICVSIGTLISMSKRHLDRLVDRDLEAAELHVRRDRLVDADLDALLDRRAKRNRAVHLDRHLVADAQHDADVPVRPQAGRERTHEHAHDRRGPEFRAACHGVGHRTCPPRGEATTRRSPGRALHCGRVVFGEGRAGVQRVAAARLLRVACLGTREADGHGRTADDLTGGERIGLDAGHARAQHLAGLTHANDLRCAGLGCAAAEVSKGLPGWHLRTV